jgi:Tfp pilus assembly protein PilF
MERQKRYASAPWSIREQQLGPDHPWTAESLNTRGNLYFAQEDYSGAEPCFRRALAIREEQLGSNHPDTAQSLHILANLYKEQSKYAEAEALYRRALAIQEQRLGPNHPDVAGTLNNLANLYSRQQKYTEGLPLLQRALAISEQTLGKNHPQTQTIRKHYDLTMQAMQLSQNVARLQGVVPDQFAAPSPIPPEVIAAAQSAGLGIPERTYGRSVQTSRSSRYMLGWTIFVAVMMLPGIVLTLVLGGGEMTSLIIGGVLILVTVGIVLLMLSLGGFFSSGRGGTLTVWGCPAGLVYRQKGQIHTIYWHDITAIRRKTGMLNGMMCTLAYIVQPATAPEFAFSLLTGPFSHMVLSEHSGGSMSVSMGAGEFARNGGFIQVAGNFTLTEYAGLGDLIEERMLEYRLPRLLEAYRAGSQLSFGSLVVRQQGLADSTRELAWADIERIQVTASTLQITKKYTGADWFNLSAANTLNFVLLTALLKAIREGKA